MIQLRYYKTKPSFSCPPPPPPSSGETWVLGVENILLKHYQVDSDRLSDTKGRIPFVSEALRVS